MKHSHFDYKVFYCGQNAGNSRSRFRALKKLNAEVILFDYLKYYYKIPKIISYAERKIKNGLFIYLTNREMVKEAIEFKPDILWVEMGREIYPSTLKKIKEITGATLVNTYSDDFLDKITNKTSRHYEKSIPLYDVIFTPREKNFPEYKKYGAKHVEKFWKGFADDHIKLQVLSGKDLEYYGCDVTFAGHNEPPRYEYLIAAAKTGAKVKIWGGGWNDVQWTEETGKLFIKSLPYDEYPKALYGAKIGLCFTSKWARDTQNSRAFEIPGSGTFMLSERTPDIINSYKEGTEAEFFSSKEEMQDKINFYLKNETAREKIAKAGYERALKSGYSNSDRVLGMMNVISRLKEEQVNSQ